MTWKRFENALRGISPGVPFAFAPGATARELDTLEGFVGHPLPEAFRRTWSEHDGMRTSPLLLLDFLSVEQIADEWRGLRDYEGSSGGLEADAIGPVKALWTSPAWIPFVLIGGETRHFCIDLDPAPGGSVGQVIHATPKGEERRVVAPDVEAFLEVIASAIRAGRYEREDDEIDVCDALEI